MGDTSNATRRFEWTGGVFTDTMLTLPAGCVKLEEGLGGASQVAFSAKEEQPQRHWCTAGCPAKQSPTPAPAYSTPRLGKGQEMSAGGNWGLMVFYKHSGGRGPALLPAEMTHMLLHLRSTRTVVWLSSLGMVAQYQHWKHLEPG